jgi:hypothetical protein
MLEADMLEAAALRRASQQLGHERQRDGAAQDMRVVGAHVAAEIAQANDPTQFGGLNAGVRVPTTLDHPGNPAVKA